MTTFLRLLKDSDKASALESSLRSYSQGSPDPERTFRVDPDKFRKVPNTPFAYWVDDSIRDLFQKLPPFESEGRTVRVGLQTSDDFRFVRAWWEVDADRRLDPGLGGAPDWKTDLAAFQAWCRNRTRQGKYWVPFAKGGEYSPYYSDIHLVVNWKDEGEEMKAFSGSVIRNEDYYFRPGVTWPERTTSGFSPQILPPGVIFSVVGHLYWSPKIIDAVNCVIAANTRLMSYLMEVLIGSGDSTVSGSAARHYTTGNTASLPAIQDLLGDLNSTERIETILKPASWRSKLDPTQLFFSPLVSKDSCSVMKLYWMWYSIFLDLYLRSIDDLLWADMTVFKQSRIQQSILVDISEEEGPCVFNLPDMDLSEIDITKFEKWLLAGSEDYVDDIVNEYGRSRWTTKKSYCISRIHELASSLFGVNPSKLINHQLQEEIIDSAALSLMQGAFCDILMGSAFGRWDLRLVRVNGDDHRMRDSNLFSVLSVCVPVSLIDKQGLPATSGTIVSEEWLRARPDAVHLPPPGSVARPTIPDSEYPIPVPWDGILAEDPDNPDDLVARIRLVLRVLHGDGAEQVERELAEGLGVQDLRDYVSDPQGFFDAHLKTYSKSRRKAPIYWPLSTKSGGYTVWIYYPRLTDATLYAVHELARKKADVLDLERAELAGRKDRSRAEQQRFDRVSRDATEVRDFAQEVLRIAGLPYKPDHDDGVPICAAPLHGLFRHSGWSKYLKETWEELQEGTYDWAHLAWALWPDRVREKARADRSLAIAHGLEDLR